MLFFRTLHDKFCIDDHQCRYFCKKRGHMPSTSLSNICFSRMSTNGNLGSLLLSCCLFLSIIASDLYELYGDFPHFALQKVPAKLGEDAELRCTKIVRKYAHTERNNYQFERYVTAFCYPRFNEKCSHAWTKDGIQLDNPEKYETNSSITSDYCENFNQSSQLINEFGSMLKNDFHHSDSDVECLFSSLIIKNVTEADFGYYSCNYSDHRDSAPRKKYEVLNIMLYNADETAIKQSKGVQYFETLYTKRQKEKILVQCVTIGGKLQWFVSPNNCFDNKCSSVPLQEIGSLDIWRSFNFSEKRHMPYPNVTESFVYFENIQKIDNVNLTCEISDIMDGKYPNGVALIKQYFYWYPHIQEMRIPLTFGLIFSMVAIMLIIFIVIAMVRVKLCACCKVTTNSPILQYQLPLQPPSYCS